MNDIQLYEQVSKTQFPMHILRFDDSDYRVRPHWHEHTEIHVLLRGGATLLCDSEPIPLTAGDCVTISGNELHQGGGGRCSFLCLLVPPSLLGNRYTVFQRVIQDEHITKLASQIAEAAASDDNASALQMHGLACLLLSHLLRHHTLSVLEESLSSKRIKDLERINHALLLMDQRYQTQLSTAFLASSVYLSEGYFCTLFKEIVGKSAMDYLNQLRVERAEELLKSSDMSISEIAYCCGFSDPNYFSRTYKRILKKTPSQTRLEKE